MKTLAAAGLIGLGAASCDKHYNEPVGPDNGNDGKPGTEQVNQKPQQGKLTPPAGEEDFYEQNSQGEWVPSFPQEIGYEDTSKYGGKWKQVPFTSEATLTIPTLDGEYTILVTYQMDSNNIWLLQPQNYIVYDKTNNRLQSQEETRILTEMGIYNYLN